MGELLEKDSLGLGALDGSPFSAVSVRLSLSLSGGHDSSRSRLTVYGCYGWMFMFRTGETRRVMELKKDINFPVCLYTFCWWPPEAYNL